jgi:hypothetical protein
MRLLSVASFVAFGALVALVALGCDGPAPRPPVTSAPSASSAPARSATAAPAASAPAANRTVHGVPIGIPLDDEKVVSVVNRRHQAPYSGPKGTLKGKVRMEGDPAPPTNLTFPDRCRDAAATYGKLFRVGLDGALADAMVAVTRYDGFVPADGPAAKVLVRGCAPRKRTVVMTFGQRLEFANLDKLEPYVPFLDGARTVAGIVAVPSGEPVKLYPNQPGRYMLRDQMPSGLVADVYVLKYATHDVTGLDGEYEIKGLPVGKVRVDVLLPVIGKGDGREVEIKEGVNTADFTLKFDAKRDMPGAAPSASASASASPSAAPSAPPRKIPR